MLNVEGPLAMLFIGVRCFFSLWRRSMTAGPGEI